MQILFLILVSLILDALYFNVLLTFMRWFWVIALVLIGVFLYMALLNVHNYP